MDSEGENTSSESATNNTPTFHIPEASRKIYESAYTRFNEWRTKNNIKSVSENVLLSYFDTLSKDYKITTLWSTYSMLRNTLLVKDNINIAHYCKLRAFLHRQSKGYLAKKSKTLSSNEIYKFIEEASDDQYLLIKVALVIGINGACKTAELCRLKVDDLVDLNSALLVKIPDAKTKVPRQFTVTGSFYEIYKKYALLRPSGCREKRFFLNYQHGKCTRQVVGVNKLGGMAHQIATYLKLPNPKLYTGNCFRRSSTLKRKRYVGWQSSSVPEGSIDESIASETIVEHKITDKVESNNQKSISTSNFVFIKYDEPNSDAEQDIDAMQDIKDGQAQDIKAEQAAEVMLKRSNAEEKSAENNIQFTNGNALEKITAPIIKSDSMIFLDFISGRMSLMKNKKKCKKFQHDVMKLLIEYEEDSDSI